MDVSKCVLLLIASQISWIEWEAAALSCGSSYGDGGGDGDGCDSGG